LAVTRHRHATELKGKS